MVQNQEQNTTMIMASFYLKVKYQSSRSSKLSLGLNLKDNRRSYMVLSITSLKLSQRVGILRRIRKIKRDIRDPLIAFYKFAPFCHEWITAALHDAAPQKKKIS